MQLVTDQSIKQQKALTEVHRLKNGLPVVTCKVASSEIVQIQVEFGRGLSDVPSGKKILNRWLMATMPRGAEGFPKEKIFSTIEKYGLELGCTGGIELSACSMQTIDEYWTDVLPMFASIVKTPTLKAADADLEKDRILADLRSTPENPSHFVNEIVNQVFYDPTHPYRQSYLDGMKELSSLGPQALTAYHKDLLNADAMAIVVVSSMESKDIVEELETAFGSIPAKKVERTKVAPPAYRADRVLAFEGRAVPNAYIMAKINAPGMTEQDNVAARLMFAILDEEMTEEIRTKRSLSYAAYAYPLSYRVGVGILGASTSYPKETMEAMQIVIDKLKTKPYSVEELEEHKHIFITEYYLQQETHVSLAGALANYQMYFGSTDPMYDFPRRLEKVNPQDIQRLARQLLKDFRVGIIYDQKKFDEAWTKKFITKTFGK